jgi:HPt (histidine-containing phosphotransfer) domain-containing protein
VSAEPVIDDKTYAELRETMGADFIGELIDTYCDETPRLVAELQQALARADAETFRRTAHSIKSSSASFGALPLAALARELEMVGKGGDLHAAGPRVEQLTMAYEEAERALRALQHAS